MTSAIAIVGMACRYPDARSPQELWENALAQRRAFRRLPQERLRLEDYFAADPAAPDRTYATEAAVLEDYTFDRVRFRVAGSTFRSADMAHWLALDMAARALEDASFPEGMGLPKESTGVLLGNTLTGEFSRANLMRLRWPYVRRTLEAALIRQEWPAEQRRAFLEELESQYKAPFPPVGEETLAGGLANTIAGRICNYFDLQGGGYTVDGACASSLLAIANACSALVAGDLDVVLAGGVDLSLDPFELVGFAKTGALAPEQMRVFDARSAGFWPGEGCGMVVLMRHADALAQNRRIYASIRGWGISSDGSGGITRPEVEGQLLAVRRAYGRAGFGVETVGYFEGHGTGTAVGDATELQTLSRARREAEPSAPPAAIGSIKASIGHTKAAAGIAGLIKATLALHTQLLPPTVGSEQPHPELAGEAPALRTLRVGEPWPSEVPLRAGVSAMGFGGINTHIALEGVAAERRAALRPSERALLSSAQDAELLLLSAPTAAALEAQVAHLLGFAAQLSRAEMGDLAAQLEHSLEEGIVRAALVASSPAELASRLETLRAWLAGGITRRIDPEAGVFLGMGREAPRLGFLFPGQGAPTHLTGGALRRRFAAVADLYTLAALPTTDRGTATEVAQPAIVTASMAGLCVLDALAVHAVVAVGHSLGELSALHWAGALDRQTLLETARARGAAMAELGDPTGAMAGIGAGRYEVEGLLAGEPVVIAGLNSPAQTVVSGPAAAVNTVVMRARALDLKTVLLPVSHAFHSTLVAAAAPPLRQHLDGATITPLQHAVVSTVTGDILPPDADLRALLERQVTSPVRFLEAVTRAQGDVDLWIEVGPGQVLQGLVSRFVSAPVLALDAGGPSLRGLLYTAGAAFALGTPIAHQALFADRFTRPFSLDWQPHFLANPCEQAPTPETASDDSIPVPTSEATPKPALTAETPTIAPLDLIRQLVAERAELPESAVRDDSRLLGDLHLNSISVSQVVVEAARRLGLPPPLAPTEFADATIAQVAQALTELAQTGGAQPTSTAPQTPPGVDAWIRTFTVERVERPLASTRRPAIRLSSDSGGEGWCGTADYASQTANPIQHGKTHPPILLPGSGLEVGQPAQAGLVNVDRGFKPVPPPLYSSSPREGVRGGPDDKPADCVNVDRADRGFNPVREGTGWQILALPDDSLASTLRAAFAVTESSGIVLCLPPEPDERCLSLLTASIDALHRIGPASRFVLVQHGGGAASFARTVFLEGMAESVCVVDVPQDPPHAAEWVVTEALAAVGYTEAAYDSEGRRWEPELRLLPLPEETAPLALGPGDVLLVTGGGKGIAAECALNLARETGIRLALLGRAQPAQDAELAANLARMTAAGITFRYFSADVTDPTAVRTTVQEAEAALGPITAVLHGAGTNTPRLLMQLDETAFQRTLAPKIAGARNVLDALDPDRLRLFVTFGSLIARTGMRGEADYALANEWLTRLTERFQAEHPNCRCLAVEWSVWSGVGMGERLGRVEALLREGITPIPPDTGLDLLRRLIASDGPVAVVVTGRFGEAPTLRLETPDLPFLRFLETPRVHYPGVELIVEAELSGDSDPYLDDHVFQGERLFPAVLGLEAMAQVAMALANADTPPVFENVRFDRPVVVPENATVTIRVAALAREPGRIDLVLRCDQTMFQSDHFRATCRFETPEAPPSSRLLPGVEAEPEHVPLDPERDLYGSLLFHRGRFRRLQGYRRLRATECLAEIAAGSPTDWFGRYLPDRLILGDPAVRDAAIHAIQACIPQATLLPIGVERILPGSPPLSGPVMVTARERARDGATFTYDLELLGPNGCSVERWEGLRLRRMDGTEWQGPWVEPLLGPYIERRLAELVSGAAPAVVIERNGAHPRRARSDRALRRALGIPAVIGRRPDGKPETNGAAAQAVSAAHAGEVTLAVAGPGPLGCDVEPVAARSATLWEGLLGAGRYALAERVAQEGPEAIDRAATRIWAAGECLKKAGAMVDAPLTLAAIAPDGWVTLRSGQMTISTYIASVRDIPTPLALAVLASNDTPWE